MTAARFAPRALAARAPELAQPPVLAAAAVWTVSVLVVWWRPLAPDLDRVIASEVAFLLLAACASAAAALRYLAARGRSARWASGCLAVGFAIWASVELFELIFRAQLFDPAFELTSDLLYLLFYSLVLVAAEIAAARPDPQRGTFHVQIELLATVIVVGALLAYFLLLPYNLDPTNRLRGVSWWSYYTLFDLLLLARLAPLARRCAPGPRRRLVGWLGAMALLLLGADAAETVLRELGGSGMSPPFTFHLYYTGLLFGAVAAAVELGRERGTGELAVGELGSALGLPRFSPVLAYVVVLPLLHLVLESIEPSPESYRTARDVLVIGTTGVLGAFAAWAWTSFRRHHLRVLAASERATEALVRSRHLEAVGRLAAGVAHDFNNRLTVILGHATRLEGRTGDDGARARAAAAIAEAAEQASRLTMELLAVGRAQPARSERLDLAASAGELVAEARQLAAPGVEVRLACEATTLPVEVDKMHLLRIVWNLAANASDAMPGGGAVDLLIGARRIESRRDAAGEPIPAGDYALLAIADRGAGMDEETIGRLFDPFFTTKEFGRGSGLGLAAVLGLIRTNGGYVLVESEPGRGSRFEVLFPLRAGE
jgi:signal transduction histidine kinase